MRAIYSEPWYFDILVDDRTGEHFIDVLPSVGPYLRRIKLTALDVMRVKENPRLLAELAERISSDSHAESDREVQPY